MLLVLTKSSFLVLRRDFLERLGVSVPTAESVPKDYFTELRKEVRELINVEENETPKELSTIKKRVFRNRP